jgi:hypothetical protein
MKHKFITKVLAFATIVFFSACNGAGSGNENKTDTTAANAQAGPSENHYHGILTKDQETAYHKAYLAHSGISDTTGKIVDGFMLDTARDEQGMTDIQKIMKLPNVKNVYIELGIKDSFKSKGGYKYVYTVVVVPVDSNNKPVHLSVSGTVTSDGDDVVCPCENGQGCCPPPPPPPGN